MIVGEGTGEFPSTASPCKLRQETWSLPKPTVLHGVRNTGETRMTFYFIKMMGKHTS